MSFASWYYPFFLAAAVLTFWLLPAGRLLFVLAASFVFYAFWDVRFCSLLIAAAASDYLCTLGMQDKPPPMRRSIVLGLLPALWLVAIDPFKHVPPIDLALAAGACAGFCVLFAMVTKMDGERRRAAFLYLAVAVNLGILLCFKYANWFSSGLQILLQHAGLTADAIVVDVLLPVGISFHTFQSIAYAVDVFDRRCEAEPRFARVLCMVMFFPQLVAGPIERAGDILPQLRFDRRFDWRLIALGGHMLLLGYFLKVFVADNCAVIADYYFHRTHLGESFGAGWALAATVAYAAQIYGDFVGYSYIARGSAILLGVQLTRNFELPLLARSPGEFWRRWHISLSTWIRDYIFLPMSLWLSSRTLSTPAPTSIWATQKTILSAALMITMLLAGLWHGAAWNYVAFGAFYGVLQVIWMLVPAAGALSSSKAVPAKVASHVITLVLIGVAWIIFRSESFGDALQTLSAIGGAYPGGRTVPPGVLQWLAAHVLPLVGLIALVIRQREEADIVHYPTVILATIYVGMIILLASSEAAREKFIYFQF